MTTPDQKNKTPEGLIPRGERRPILIKLLELRKTIRSQKDSNNDVDKIDRVAEEFATNGTKPPEIVLTALNESNDGLGELIRTTFEDRQPEASQAPHGHREVVVTKEDPDFFELCENWEEIENKLLYIDKVGDKTKNDIQKTFGVIRGAIYEQGKEATLFGVIGLLPEIGGLQNKVRKLARKEYLEARNGPKILIPIFEEMERRLNLNPPYWLAEGELTHEIDKTGPYAPKTKDEIKQWFYYLSRLSELSEMAQEKVFAPQIRSVINITELRKLIDRTPDGKTFDLDAKKHALGAIDTVASGRAINVDVIEARLPKTPFGQLVLERILTFAKSANLTQAINDTEGKAPAMERMSLDRLKDLVGRAPSLEILSEVILSAEASNQKLFSEENGLTSSTKYILIISALLRNDVAVLDGFKPDDFIITRIKLFGDYDESTGIIRPKSKKPIQSKEGPVAKPGFIEKLFGKKK